MQKISTFTEKLLRNERREANNNDMNNKEFIAALSKKSGFSLEDTQKLVRGVLDAMYANFEEGEAVSITNFGSFEVKKRLERMIVNPQTRQKMLVPPKLVLNFKPFSSVKKTLKKGGEE